MGLDEPDFSPGYAILVVVVLAGLVSLVKPRKCYAPICWHDYKNILDYNRKKFWNDRLNIWALRFVYYYSGPWVSPVIFALDSIFISVIASFRLQNDFHDNLKIMQLSTLCDSYSTAIHSDFQSLQHTAHIWNKQLTWCLVVYFFQKLFNATLLINGGGTTIIACLLFDTWLLISVIIGSVLQSNLSSINDGSAFAECYDANPDDALFTSMQDVWNGLNGINALMWIMMTLTLPFGIFLDLIFTSCREWNYMFNTLPEHKKQSENQQKTGEEIEMTTGGVPHTALAPIQDDVELAEDEEKLEEAPTILNLKQPSEHRV